MLLASPSSPRAHLTLDIWQAVDRALAVHEDEDVDPRCLLTHQATSTPKNAQEWTFMATSGSAQQKRLDIAERLLHFRVPGVDVEGSSLDVTRVKRVFLVRFPIG